MPYDPDIHHRRSIRLRGYDYSSAGAYFVTICTQNRECLFGNISGDTVHLSAAGQIVDEEWRHSADIRDEIALDTWVIMPNHIHGIVIIKDLDDRGVRPHAPATSQLGGRPKSLSSFIIGFKSATKIRINTLRGMPGTSVWQRNYYERVIRNERECDAIRKYILQNPQQWVLDEDNPDRDESSTSRGVRPHAPTTRIVVQPRVPQRPSRRFQPTCLSQPGD